MAEFLITAVAECAVSLVADELVLSYGVKKQLKKLISKLEMIQSLLSDAHTKQLTSLAVQNWLKQLKSIALDAQIVLDDFGYQVLREKVESRKRDKVRGFFSHSNPVLFRLEMAHKIKEVLSSLEDICKESGLIGLLPVDRISSLPDIMAKRLTDPYVQDSDIVGRDEDVSRVLSMLIHLIGPAPAYEKGLPVITILGMGGQGKTTLAQLVYKSDKLGSYFKKKVWICVSDFNVEKILTQILQSLTLTTCLLSGREPLVNKLKQELGKEIYLLVLDDAWNENRDEWDVLRRCLLEIGGAEGSKIMATTRSEEVAIAMRTSRYHQLQLLSEEESLDLFEKCAFALGGANKTPELMGIAKRILKRCGGVPLAIKAIGGLLYSKNSASEWSMIERSELWNVPNTQGGGVLSAIRLSYDHLPSPFLKHCFAYCATFPKDSIFQEDILVQLWMSQGFLNPPEGSQLQMEDMGSICLNILLKSSLLQEVPKTRNNNIMQCKMHDLVHDFSLEVSESCIINRDCTIGRKEREALHLYVTNAYEKGLWTSLKGTVSSKLRSLKLGYGFCDVLEDWFVKFRCLTVLTIEVQGTSDLPNAIGKITHLRFLDIHRTTICKLPKSFIELYYLQTLRVKHLDELPHGFESLINLRHLYLTQRYLKPRCLLTGIGQLTNLQTLPYFTVDESMGCRIEELEHLDNLRGELKIFCLQNVSCDGSSLRANLSKKSNIRTLELHWDRRVTGYGCDDTDVMEGLKLHSHLKSLEIDGYQGQNFPSWMVANDGVMLQRNMVKLVLKNLDSCQHLPSLGDLPCLEHPQLPNVKCIGKEFYGWSNLEAMRKSSSSANGVEMTLFPALRVLKFCFMYSLEVWSDAHLAAKLFPALEELEMTGLPNLNVFPNLGRLPCLQHLRMASCDNLTLPSSWNRLIHSSTEEAVSPLFDNSLIGYFPSLCKLSIRFCNKLVAPFCSLKTISRLQSLCILGSPGLWPKDLHHLTNLESLQLEGRPRDIDCFPWPHYISSPTHSLTSLKLLGWPQITSLSDDIQYVTSLERLEINNFSGLEAVPEWLGKLHRLQDLCILRCKNLKQLPSADAFQHLTSLRGLTVSGCPLLEERCTKGSRKEWFKIAHIPYITFDKRFHRSSMKGDGHS